jgi:hypothetical protein
MVKVIFLLDICWYIYKGIIYHEKRRNMNKYQVSVFFSVDEEFMNLVPKHRGVISDLILKGVIDSYAISAEVGRGWITMNGKSKSDVHKQLERSPLYKYFELEIDQLMVYDSQMYRFPKMVLN